MYPVIIALFITLSLKGVCAISINQTENLSPILPEDSLPYTISIELADFQLPSDSQNATGIQSFAFGIYQNKWLLIGGRTNGVHGFNLPPDSFPVSMQNTTVYVVDLQRKTTVSRSLKDPSSQLSQLQIDTLSTTSVQFNQSNNTLYLVGGYGIDTASGEMTTKSTLTAIDIPAFISWVENGDIEKSAAQCIRQVDHPLLQVTGGYLTQVSPHQPNLLVFGQAFTGLYSVGSTGEYTQQIRPFKIIDNGRDLYVKPEKQFPQNPNYNRRDLSVVPIMQRKGNSFTPSLVALSGVFTANEGVWTVPVLINGDGTSVMPDPSNPNTFMQGMNNYDCAHAGLFSKSKNEMYILLFGGISYLYLNNGVITPDAEIPFINSVTTVKIDSKGNFGQYLMANEYPVILSTFSNPGNPLIFGANARFIPASNMPLFPNEVISFDQIGGGPLLIGYIVGGIQSTIANTLSITDSSSSPYIFSVYLQKK